MEGSVSRYGKDSVKPAARICPVISVSATTARARSSLERATKEAPVVNQIEWSPFGHSDATLEFCREENLQVGDFNLRAADLAKLDALNERYSALGALPYE